MSQNLINRDAPEGTLKPSGIHSSAEQRIQSETKKHFVPISSAHENITSKEKNPC